MNRRVMWLGPIAEDDAWIMFVEPAQTRHTGDVESPLTKSIEAQIAHRD